MLDAPPPRPYDARGCGERGGLELSTASCGVTTLTTVASAAPEAAAIESWWAEPGRPATAPPTGLAGEGADTGRAKRDRVVAVGTAATGGGGGWCGGAALDDMRHHLGKELLQALMDAADAPEAVSGIAGAMIDPLRTHIEAFVKEQGLS